MSDPVFDPVELRGRIVVCFSIGELRELAASLGVAGSIPWERGIHEAARELVRQCERYAGLPALVAKLREVRPLVEWPEAAPAPVSPAAYTSAPLPAPAPEPAIADPFAPAPSPGGFAPAVMPVTMAPSAPQPALAPQGTFAPQQGAFAPPQATSAPPQGAFSPQATFTPPKATSPSPMWPGMVTPPAPPARGGVDPRILLAVAGLMVLAAIIAYFAGRASTTTADASPAGSANARESGPAALASERMARSLANIARACELPPSAAGGDLVFRRVFERCGPVPVRERPPQAAVTPPPEPRPDPDDPPPEPGRPRPTKPRPKAGGNPDTGPTEATPAPSKGCMGSCDSDHRACKSRCGPEPTESGGYDNYQRCLGRCLSDASRCRLGCR